MKAIIERAWYPILLFIACSLLLVLVLWVEQNSLVIGWSKAEAEQAVAAGSWRTILENPIGLPHKLLALVFSYADGLINNPVRSASATLGLIYAGSYFYILKQWYTRRIALLGTLMLASSAWFLHSARLGTDSILYSGLIVAVACTVWMQKPRSGLLAIGAGSLVMIMLLYTPGMIWLVVPALLWQYKRIGHLLQNQHAALLTCLTILTVGALAPLGWSLYQYPELVKTYFGLPEHVPSVTGFIENLMSVPAQLFYQGPNNPEMWLGRLPLLDWFAVIMLAVGAYAYISKRKLDRTWFIVYVLAAGTLLIALNGPVTMTVLLPFIYLIIAGGVALMLQQWFTVFPRNPVARILGATLLTATLLLSVYYNATRYFIAWPNTPETRAEFQQQPR